MTAREQRTLQGIEDSLFDFAEFDASAGERGGYSNYSYWGSTLRMFLKNKTAVIALCTMIVLLAFTFIQPYLPNQKDPVKVYLDPETGRQMMIIELGALVQYHSISQDLWSRIWSSTRTSLLIALAGDMGSRLRQTFGRFGAMAGGWTSS